MPRELSAATQIYVQNGGQTDLVPFSKKVFAVPKIKVYSRKPVFTEYLPCLSWRMFGTDGFLWGGRLKILGPIIFVGLEGSEDRKVTPTS